MNVSFQIVKKITGGYEWSNYGRIISPLNIGLSLKNEATESYTINLYMKGTDASLDALIPGTICKVNVDSSSFQFVVIDGGRVEQNGLATFVNHSYVVQPLVCFFRDVYIQTSYFSSDAYTLAAFIERLLKLTKCDYPVVFSQQGAYNLMLENWNKPSYQVASNAFLDNLIKIGNLLQVRINAEFVISAGYGYMRLISSALHGSGSIGSIAGNYIGESEEYKSATFASKAISDVSNLKSDNTRWFPIDHKINGMSPEPDGDNETITADNAILNLGFPILRAFKVRAMGFGVVVTDSNVAEGAEDYRYYDYLGNEILPDAGKYLYYYDTVDYRQTAYVATEFDVIEHREWLMLDPDSSGGAPKHQQNTLYFKYGENKIFNIGICEGYQPGTYLYRRDVIQGGQVAQSTYKTQRLRFHLNYYNALVDLATNGLVSASNLKENNRMILYSQDENMPSGRALFQNMSGRIQSMENPEYSRTYEFESISTMPALGNIFNDFVISQISMRIDYKRIRASFILSDEKANTSEYINPDAGLVLPAIPLDKAFDRKTLYRTQVWLTATLADAQTILANYGADTYFNDSDYTQTIFAAFRNGRQNPPSTPCEVRIRVGDDSDDYLHSASPITVAIADNNMVLSLKLDHPSVLGKLVDTTIGTSVGDVKYYPVTYIDEVNAFAQVFYFKFAVTTVRQNEANYPRIGSASFAIPGLANIEDQDYYHDAAERPNVTYQLTVRNGSSYGKVTQVFFEETGFIKDCFTAPGDLFTRYIVFNNVSYLIGNVTFTLQQSKIWSIKIHIDNYLILSGTIAAVRIYRDNGVVQENLVTTFGKVGVVGGTSQRYIEIFATYTQ